MKYEFDKYDHINKLDIVMKYRNIELLIDYHNKSFVIFAIDGFKTDIYEPLCIGGSIDEIKHKLEKICSMLAVNDNRYYINWLCDVAS